MAFALSPLASMHRRLTDANRKSGATPFRYCPIPRCMLFADTMSCIPGLDPKEETSRVQPNSSLIQMASFGG